MQAFNWLTGAGKQFFFSQKHEKRIYVFSFAVYEIFLFIFHDKNELKMSIRLGLAARSVGKILCRLKKYLTYFISKEHNLPTDTFKDHLI